MERKQPVKTKPIALDGEYAGWECTVRTNPPLKAFGDVASGNFDRIITGLAAIIKAWNFVDEEGGLLPPPSTTTISELPLDLATAVANKYVGEISTLPPA